MAAKPVGVLDVRSETSEGKASDEWFTPKSVIIPARMVLGDIDLDPASCATAQAVIRARRWYTRQQNGLAQPWRGRIWLNPPYSQPLPWATRLAQELEQGHVSAALVLTSLATSPEWARLLWACRTAACLFDYRIRFWHPDRAANGYDRDSQLLYFGPRPDVFRAVFSSHGQVV